METTTTEKPLFEGVQKFTGNRFAHYALNLPDSHGETVVIQWAGDLVSHWQCAGKIGTCKSVADGITQARAHYTELLEKQGGPTWSQLS